jgi:histidinol-phosphate aminotransferase
MHKWNIENMVSDGIRAIIPYKPGKPIEDLEREMGIKDSLKIASNENPIGPSPKAVEAIRAALPNLHRYPDGNATVLKEKLAKKLGVTTANLIIGNGSNEILELALRTYLGSGGSVVYSEHAFIVYKLVTQAAGGRGISVPMSGFTHDLKKMAKAIEKDTRLVFVANPNNPTGTFNTKKEIEALIEALPEKCILVLDEAYKEYVENPSYPDSLKYLDRPVIVARTMSKLHGLAGLRLGYGVAQEDIIQYMNRVRQPFNVNSLAQIAAAAALDDTEHQEKARKVNREGMSYLTEKLKAMDLTWVPSVANFILVNVEKPGTEVFQALLHKGVIVRPMAEYDYPEYIRVTIGTKEQNMRFIKALGEVLGRNAIV